MRVLAVLTYKGTLYQGWQRQVDEPSIQKTIEEVISKILNAPTVIYASGRTDSGVHALGQTFHFDIEKKIDLDQLRYSINCLLPNDIHIKSLKEVSSSFHARYDARKKVYCYKILLGEDDPLLFDYYYIYHQAFDYSLFKKVLKHFIGTHNYQNFTSKKEDKDNFIRTIYRIKVQKKSNKISITFIGNGFMRYMIRNIVGYAFAVMENKETLSTLKKLLDDNLPRHITSYKAPAKGLYLKKVIY